MMKDQFKLFLKVLLGFGQLYLAVNILFLTEILTQAFHSLNQLQPLLVLDQYFIKLNYIPGSSIELLMRISGAMLLISSLHLNWVLYRSPMSQWKRSLLVNTLFLASFFFTIICLNIQVPVLYNSLGFSIANGGVLIGIYRRKNQESRS